MPTAPQNSLYFPQPRSYRRGGKRLLDVVLAAPLLLLALPLLAGAALLAASQGRGRWLFRQQRPGRHGRLFTLYKIKTMTDARDATGQLRPDAERLPPLGRWLRATSLDELPQLWNIVRGDLSLVGPRRAPRPHRLGPGEWPQRHRLGREVCLRRVVRRPFIVGPGPAHFMAHGRPGTRGA